MTRTEKLKALLGPIQQRLNNAKADGSLMLRIPTWVTAGDGRQFMYHAVDDLARLTRIVEAAGELAEAIQKEFPCEIHDYEPNTTMDFFRCDKCGIRPRIGDSLAAFDAALDGEEK